MVNLINSWAQSIIVSVIIAVIIEMILPEGNNKKYIKIVLSVYILLAIVHPIVKQSSNKKIDINSIINSSNKEIKKYEQEKIAIDTNAYIEKTYIDSLEESIIKALNDKGYMVINIDLKIENEETEKYGQISSIDIFLTRIKDDENNSTSIIQEINIDTTEIKEIKEKNIAEEEITALKDYIKNSYNVEINQIHINE